MQAPKKTKILNSTADVIKLGRDAPICDCFGAMLPVWVCKI